ncbi:MAG: PQQ-dependent sugar dehydrogenase [Pseudomonadota bacterium]
MFLFRVFMALAAIAVASSANAVQSNAPQPRVLTGAKTTTIATGLSRPWGMQMLPDGRFIVTERTGNIRIVKPGGEISSPLRGAPDAVAMGQSGMLDIALAPDFQTSKFVYVSFTERREGGRNGTSVARARLVSEDGADRFENLEIVFRQKPAFSGGLHFGSRFAFAPDGKLFITLGERYQKDYAQDLNAHLGKVVRINPDGSMPADNPYVGRPDARPEIWSFGHRNPQSAAIHPATGELWTVEHGARGGDEINIPKPGANYGWPIITYGRDYSGAKIGTGTHNAGMEQPIYYWDPSIAPCGMAFYSAERFPQWQGNLFVGALKDRQLSRLVLKGNNIVAEEILLTRLRERIRDVRQGHDGYLYVLTDSIKGRLIRIEPARN